MFFELIIRSPSFWFRWREIEMGLWWAGRKEGGCGWWREVRDVWFGGIGGVEVVD